MEPTFVALGPANVALGMNNHVLFHSLTEGCPLIREKEYIGSVEAIKLNADYVAVLSEGRIALDALADDGSGSAIARVYPEDGNRDVTCLSLTRDFLIFGTSRGTITMIYLPELAVVCDFSHDGGAIASIFPNNLGTRVAYLDASGGGYLLSPVSEQAIAVRHQAKGSKQHPSSATGLGGCVRPTEAAAGLGGGCVWRALWWSVEAACGTPL